MEGPLESAITLAAAFEALSAECSPACLLDERLRIVGVNGAWDAFARANGGDEGCLGPALAGSAYLRHIDGLEPRTRIALALARALEGDRASSDSEYGTAEQFRILRTNYIPVRATGAGPVCGVLVVHSPVVEFPVAPAPAPRPTGPEASTEITICSSCRRVRRLGQPGDWAYLPEALVGPPARVSHGFCPACAVQYGLTPMEMKAVLTS